MSTYTNEMIQKMRDAAPLNKEKAGELAADFGLPVRSVIAKAAREGIAYEKATPATKREKGVTKSDRVAAIASALQAEGKDAEALATLEKASVSALAVLARIVGATSEEQTD